jgi:hypothetical protein
MRHPARALLLPAALLLASTAALAGCIRLAQPEQLPSPYAGHLAGPRRPRTP